MKILTIDINSTCNLECAFCYQQNDAELSAEKIMDIVKSNPNFDTVEIGGGEPFMHRQILDVLLQIAGNGRDVNVSTNAVFIPEGLLGLESRVKDKITLQVSLPAASSELYEHITKRPFFTKVVKNIERMKKEYNVILTSSIYGDNFDNVPEILGLSYSLSLPVRVNLVFPVGCGKDVELLSEGKVDNLRGLLLAESLQHKGMIQSPLIRPNNCYALEQAYGIRKAKKCLADFGLKKYINPKGEASKCEFLGGENDNCQ
ncbi:MAG: radical SAM protein [Candidatus Woesearchaeota archaeon]